MVSQQIQQIQLSIRCLEVLASDKCTQRSSSLLPSPTASLSTKRWEADSHFSAIPSALLARMGGGQVTDDCVLMSLYTHVIRCLVVGTWKVCMPTTLVLGVLDTHPPEFCSVKPPISSVIHCFWTPRKKARVRLMFACYGGSLALCVFVSDEGFLNEARSSFHWELQ